MAGLTPAGDLHRFQAVITFANNVLSHGRDHYRPNPTPLFSDGIDTQTGQHIHWRLPGGRSVVISNLACQQNLFRTLTALTQLTGDSDFKDAAKTAIKYHFDNYADPSGLLQWGGHRFIDLQTLQIVGPAGKWMMHELKNTFPFFDLMHEVNSTATCRFVGAFWNAHVGDWAELSVNRHGPYGLDFGDVWGQRMVDLPPLRESRGLSFINVGSDLIYAAGTLYRLTGDARALAWAKHLANQYVRARDPITGLGAYQFSQPRKIADTNDDNDTDSKYGDRAQRQLGPEFGKQALEGNVLLKAQAEAIYGASALMQIQLAAELAGDANELLRTTCDGLISFATHAYIPETNLVSPMLTNGCDLSNYALRRNGYYGTKGTVLSQYPACPRFLLSYARGFLVTRELALWTTLRAIARGNGIGDFGPAPSERGQSVDVNLETNCNDAHALLAVIDIYRATSNEHYLDLGRAIGNNIVSAHSHRGYFTAGPEFTRAQFDRVEPLALLTLHAALQDSLCDIPNYIAGRGFIHGGFEFPDGRVREIYDAQLYSPDNRYSPS